MLSKPPFISTHIQPAWLINQASFSPSTLVRYVWYIHTLLSNSKHSKKDSAFSLVLQVSVDPSRQQPSLPRLWLGCLLVPSNPTFGSYGFYVHLFIWRQFVKWQIKLYQKVNFFVSWKDCSLQCWSLYCWLLKLKSSFLVQFGMGRIELTTPKIEISVTS